MYSWNNVTGFSFNASPLVDNTGANSGTTSRSTSRRTFGAPAVPTGFNGYVTAHDFKPVTLTINGIPLRTVHNVHLCRRFVAGIPRQSVRQWQNVLLRHGKRGDGRLRGGYQYQLGDAPVGQLYRGRRADRRHANDCHCGNLAAVRGLCGVEIVNTTPAPSPLARWPAARPGRLARTSRNRDGPALPPGFPGAQAGGIPERIFGGIGPQFRDTAPAKGMLVGFEIGLGKWGPNDIVGAVRPIFVNERGEEVLGSQHGKVNGQTIRIKAKPGYAVGAITAKSVAALDGFSVTFMKIEKDRLNPADKYESDWVGGGGTLPQATVGGDGTPAIGIVGYGSDTDCSGMGLIFAPPKAGG